MSVVETRPARAQDAADVRAVVLSAFAHHPEVADLVDELRDTGRMVVELVAVDGGEVVGHVALDECWIDDEVELARTVCLSPLGVRSDRQGAGIGTRLVTAALEAARERGEGYVFLEGDPAFYGPRGFGPALGRGFVRPSERIPGPAFQVAVLEDRGVTGRLVYPDAF